MYGPLQQFVEELGQRAVDCIANLEKGTKPVAAGTLRSLRKLQTPAARADIVPWLLTMRRPQRAEVERVIDAAAKRMWVDFHWDAQNTFLTADVGVPVGRGGVSNTRIGIAGGAHVPAAPPPPGW